MIRSQTQTTTIYTAKPPKACALAGHRPHTQNEAQAPVSYDALIFDPLHVCPIVGVTRPTIALHFTFLNLATCTLPSVIVSNAKWLCRATWQNSSSHRQRCSTRLITEKSERKKETFFRQTIGRFEKFHFGKFAEGEGRGGRGCVCVRGMPERKLEGGENVSASGCACSVFFYQSIQDIAPAIHQLTCRPNANKMAVTCPAAISFDLFFGKKKIRRRTTSVTMCGQATVILGHTRRHLDKSCSVFRKDGEDSWMGKRKGSSTTPRERDETVMVLVGNPNPLHGCLLPV